MTRARHRRLLGIGIATLLLAQAAIGSTVTAQDAEVQETPLTIWGANAPSGLDGIGSFFVAAVRPEAKPGQEADHKWRHGLLFKFVGSATPYGILSLDTDGPDRFASITLDKGSGNVVQQRVPYDWTAGQFYFLLAVPVAGNAVVGFVLDLNDEVWTQIGSVTGEASFGKLSPASATLLQWYGDNQPDCLRYPRADAFLSAPFGIVSGDSEPRVGVPALNFVTEADCQATVTDEPDPVLFRRYTAGSSTAPAPTTSTSSSTSASTSSSSTSSSTSTSTSTTSATLLPPITLFSAGTSSR